MCENKQNLENRKEACKTYIEQTKLLVTLASVFLMAPAAFFSLMNAKPHTFWHGISHYLNPYFRVTFFL